MRHPELRIRSLLVVGTSCATLAVMSAGAQTTSDESPPQKPAGTPGAYPAERNLDSYKPKQAIVVPQPVPKNRRGSVAAQNDGAREARETEKRAIDAKIRADAVDKGARAPVAEKTEKSTPKSADAKPAKPKKATSEHPQTNHN
jgi:hypothetical protein